MIRRSTNLTTLFFLFFLTSFSWSESLWSDWQAPDGWSDHSNSKQLLWKSPWGSISCQKISQANLPQKNTYWKGFYRQEAGAHQLYFSPQQSPLVYQVRYQLSHQIWLDHFFHQIPGAPPMSENLFGKSVKGQKLTYQQLGKGPKVVLALAAMHGDEPTSKKLLDRWIRSLQNDPQKLDEITLITCSNLNPDGLDAGTRVNANQVDLNRNYPTSNWSHQSEKAKYWGGPKPASEPETQALIRLIQEIQPQRILTIHAPYKEVNYDGPAQSLAEGMSQRSGYPATASIGYPTPGSFGTWAGREKKIPTITLELPEHQNMERIWEENQSSLDYFLHHPFP